MKKKKEDEDKNLDRFTNSDVVIIKSGKGKSDKSKK